MMHASYINYLYILILAIFTGYEVISRVPTILHTPLMSGTNFIHGIILIGTMAALASTTTPIGQIIGFFAVLIATINAVGGYIVTKRMLGMFISNDQK